MGAVEGWGDGRWEGEGLDVGKEAWDCGFEDGGPVGGEEGEDGAFGGDTGGEGDVEGGDAVGCDEEEGGGVEGVDVADFAFVDEGEVRLGVGREDEGIGRHGGWVEVNLSCKLICGFV